MSDMTPNPAIRDLWKCPRCGFTRINMTDCQCEINPAKLQMALRGDFLMDKDEVKKIEIDLAKQDHSI